MKNYSQIGQDLFVCNMLNNKTNGLFLDIGAQGPHHINNTYMLEKELNWTGASIEIDPACKDQWMSSDRDTTNFISQDALTVDYDQLLASLTIDSNKRVDYLSVDLEPPSITLEALMKIPLHKYRFSVITYEHDMYRSEFLNKYHQYYTLFTSRGILYYHGYRLISSNAQEDWWVDSQLFDESSFVHSNGKEFSFIDINIIAG